MESHTFRAIYCRLVCPGRARSYPPSQGQEKECPFSAGRQSLHWALRSRARGPRAGQVRRSLELRRRAEISESIGFGIAMACALPLTAWRIVFETLLVVEYEHLERRADEDELGLVMPAVLLVGVGRDVLHAAPTVVRRHDAAKGTAGAAGRRRLGRLTAGAQVGRDAFVTVLYGASARYAAEALVLGSGLRRSRAA